MKASDNNEHDISCPLCEAEVEHKELKKNDEESDNKTYIWVCSECPGVLVEWIDSRDTRALTEYLHGGE